MLSEKEFNCRLRWLACGRAASFQWTVDVFTGEGNVHRSGQSRVGSVATSEEYQSVDLVTDDVTMTSRGAGRNS